MTKIMLASGPSCLHNSSLWTLFYNAMYAHWDARRKGVTSSFKHCMPSIRATDIPSPQSFGIKFTSFGTGYMHAELALPIHGGYHSPFYSHILKKKGIKGTSEDRPFKEHSFFGRNQWNQSQSHMPRGINAPIPAVERMDEAPMDREEATAQQNGGKGPVVMGRTEYEFLCDEMSFF